MLVDETLWLIGEPELGPLGLDIVRARFARTFPLIWKRGDPEGKVACRARIDSRAFWPVVISFYADLYILPEQLSRMGLAVNIHPALPCLPGLAHGTYPLLDRHTSHGATLHFMDEQLDHGKIIGVREWALPAQATYQVARRLGQAASLALLAECVECLAAQPDWKSAVGSFEKMSELQPRQWNPHYFSQSEVLERLQRVYLEQPHHPVFVGNPWRPDR